MKKSISTILASLALITTTHTSAFAWKVERDHGSWVEIRCGGGTIRGVKQRSNGKWTDTCCLQNFGSFRAAADNTCRGRGG